MAHGNGNGPLSGAVIAVAGAGGPAGRATLARLADAGATVIGSSNDDFPERLAEAVDAARYGHGGATVVGDTVDLLDLESTRDWAIRIEKDFGHVDRPGPPGRRLAGQRDLHQDEPRQTGTSWSCCSSARCRTRPSRSTRRCSAATVAATS